MRTALNRWSIGLALGVLVVGMGPEAASGQCRTNADTVATYLRTARGIFAAADSANLVSHGYPFARPAQISAATDTTVCSAAVAAYNAAAQVTGTSNAIASAYVFTIGSAGWIVVSPSDTTGEYLMYHIFDSSWVLKESLGG
jgi:hypothetical protein